MLPGCQISSAPARRSVRSRCCRCRGAFGSAEVRGLLRRSSGHDRGRCRSGEPCGSMLRNARRSLLLGVSMRGGGGRALLPSRCHREFALDVLRKSAAGVATSSLVAALASLSHELTFRTLLGKCYLNLASPLEGYYAVLLHPVVCEHAPRATLAAAVAYGITASVLVVVIGRPKARRPLVLLVGPFIWALFLFGYAGARSASPIRHYTPEPAADVSPSPPTPPNSTGGGEPSPVEVRRLPGRTDGGN